ncbi:hypothetical protein DY000_02050899 [Brassica cretica]|uniref:Uncharacterized protein n=1 Tax=Brassica cretica TaxID=69181 RepID=A0ABQ7EYS8_BRACR|nr:hypothetical protein DY000_02050899 [Brassica cretica]
MEHKIIELEKQQVDLKEKICQMESCARERGVELDNLKSEFKATSSAPCFSVSQGLNLSKEGTRVQAR